MSDTTETLRALWLRLDEFRNSLVDEARGELYDATEALGRAIDEQEAAEGECDIPGHTGTKAKCPECTAAEQAQREQDRIEAEAW